MYNFGVPIYSYVSEGENFGVFSLFLDWTQICGSGSLANPGAEQNFLCCLISATRWRKKIANIYLCLLLYVVSSTIIVPYVLQAGRRDWACGDNGVLGHMQEDAPCNRAYIVYSIT